MIFYLAGVCVGLMIALLLIIWDLELEVGVVGGDVVDGVGAGRRELGELGLLRALAGLRRVGEGVLQQDFLNRLPHLQQDILGFGPLAGNICLFVIIAVVLVSSCCCCCCCCCCVWTGQGRIRF